MENQNNKLLYAVNEDILCLFNATSSIGWQSLNKLSIYRILFLISVIFSFRFPDQTSPYASKYHFAINYRGPIEETISNSLVFLESREYIESYDDGISYSLNPEADQSKFRYDCDVLEWFDVIVQLLSIHGVDKVYEFVIRDPEYRHGIEIQTTKELNISNSNITVAFLSAFKNDFEESLEDDASQIDHTEYLSLYFEYVFSKIVKGDINL